MKIHQLTLNDVVSSTVITEHNSFQFNQKNVPRSIEFCIDIDKWNESLKEDPALEEFFEDYEDSILGVAANTFENCEYQSNIFTATITIEDKKGDYSPEDLTELLNAINTEVQNVIDKSLGANLEHFISRKQEEKEHDIIIDNYNDINKILFKAIIESESPLNQNLITKSSNIERNIDLRAEYKNYLNDFSFEVSRNKDARSLVIETIQKSDIVESVRVLPNSYRAVITLNDIGDKLLNNYIQQANKDFYGKPYHAEQSDCKFITKGSDGKGSKVDAWLNKDNSIRIVSDSSTYNTTLNNLDLKNNIGYYVKLAIDETKLNSVNNRRNKP